MPSLALAHMLEFCKTENNEVNTKTTIPNTKLNQYSNIYGCTLTYMCIKSGKKAN